MSKKKKGAPASTPSDKKSKNFTLELYPEWQYIAMVLTYITSNYDYAMILHNKDIDSESGKPKKDHIHAVIRCPSRRRLSSVKNEFAEKGVAKNLINTCNERAMIRYLTHIDDKEKYQYDRAEIKTNMPKVVEIAYKDDVSNDDAFYLIDKWIDEQKGNISQHTINEYVYNQGLLGGLRKYGSQINNARLEHNRQIENEMIIEGKAEIKAVQIAKSRDVKTAETMKLLDMFGVIQTEIPNENGVMIPVTIALRKPENEPENEPKQQTAIWEGLPQK